MLLARDLRRRRPPCPDHCNTRTPTLACARVQERTHLRGCSITRRVLRCWYRWLLCGGGLRVVRGCTPALPPHPQARAHGQPKDGDAAAVRCSRHLAASTGSGCTQVAHSLGPVVGFCRHAKDIMHWLPFWRMQGADGLVGGSRRCLADVGQVCAACSAEQCRAVPSSAEQCRAGHTQKLYYPPCYQRGEALAIFF